LNAITAKYVPHYVALMAYFPHSSLGAPSGHESGIVLSA
jgi:hypothetical protein